jgi:general secretion pathway protein M
MKLPTRTALATAWNARQPREKRLLLMAALVIAAALAWLAIAPAVRTLKTTPAQLAALETQLQAMQRLADEAQALRGTPPVPMEQGRVALQASAAQLGDKARVSLQGERAVLTLTGLPAEQLTGWLAEVRINARARVVESQLQRTPEGGYAGTVVLAFGSGA